MLAIIVSKFMGIGTPLAVVKDHKKSARKIDQPYPKAGGAAGEQQRGFGQVTVARACAHPQTIRRVLRWLCAGLR
jgi:hypothetical protein